MIHNPRSTSKDDVFPATTAEAESRPRRPKPRASYENVWIPPRERREEDEEEEEDDEEEDAATPEVSTASSSCRSSLTHDDKPPSSIPPTLPRRNTREAIQRLLNLETDSLLCVFCLGHKVHAR